MTLSDAATTWIRATAYEKWRAAGSPEGDGTEFWLQAEREYLEGKSAGGRESDDPVVEASAESFPASDPPAWVASAASANSPAQEPKRPSRPRTRSAASTRSRSKAPK